METLKQILPILVRGSLAALVLSVSLDSTREQFLYLLKRPAQLGRAVMAVSVLTPAAAVVLVSVLPLHAVSKAGIILLSISPVPPFVPGRNRSVGGSREYVYGLFAAFALLAIVIVPLSVLVMDWIFGARYLIGPWPIARLILISVAIPLGIGQIIRRFAPGFAERAGPIVVKFALAVLVLALIPFLIRLWPIFGSLVGDGSVLAGILFAIAALAIGHLLGGPDPGDRAALAITAGTRHPGIALLVASANTADKRIAAAAVMCFLICAVVTMVYQLAAKRRLAHPGGAHPAAT
jgi:BASS family bile acid:Na+ symporter